MAKKGNTVEPRPTWQKILIALGGLGGLIGIAIGVLSLIQNQNANQSQDVAQSTVIWIMSAQLEVQQEIATFQASRIDSDPTATAVADRINQLEATQTYLETQRQLAEAALTAVSSSSSNPITLPPSQNTASSCVPSQKVGVCVELSDFSRFENTITAKFHFVNSGQSEQTTAMLIYSYLLDEATQKRYSVSTYSNGTIILPPNTSFDGWTKYSIPGDQHPQYLTVVLADGVLFEHVPVRQQ
jgi:hypothetical protein